MTCRCVQIFLDEWQTVQTLIRHHKSAASDPCTYCLLMPDCPNIHGHYGIFLVHTLQKEPLVLQAARPIQGRATHAARSELSVTIYRIKWILGMVYMTVYKRCNREGSVESTWTFRSTRAPGPCPLHDFFICPPSINLSHHYPLATPMDHGQCTATNHGLEKRRKCRAGSSPYNIHVP